MSDDSVVLLRRRPVVEREERFAERIATYQEQGRPADVLAAIRDSCRSDDVALVDELVDLVGSTVASWSVDNREQLATATGWARGHAIIRAAMATLVALGVVSSPSSLPVLVPGDWRAVLPEHLVEGIFDHVRE